MPAASYTTDLTDWIIDSDVTAWTELTNATNGGAPDEADTESALQGTNSCSQVTNTTALCSLIRILASPVTLAADNVFLVWHGHGVATALDTYANGGLRVAVCGNAVGNWKAWSVGGNDVAPFPYAKWVNTPIDPTVTADYTLGTPPTGGTSVYGVGSMCILTAVVVRGQPHICDMIRYGRAESRMNGGDIGSGYATFDGYATQNDTLANRWGLIQKTTGGFQWKGLMILGYSSAVDFRDSNVNIYIQDCRKVTSGFNKIEIRNASSRVDWTSISFLNVAPSTAISKGAFEVIDNADVNIVSCSFTDMNTFIFLAASTIDKTTFLRCALITLGGAAFTGCAFTSATGSTAVTGTPAHCALVSTSSFTSDGTGYAMEITGTAANMSLNAVTFTGYAGTNGVTGNEAIFVNIATGSMTISITGSGSTPSIRTAGCVITVQTPVTVTVTVKDVNTGTAIENARVLVEKVSDGADILTGLTNASGVATTSFAYVSDIAVTGKVRRATVAYGTFYKTASISTTLTNAGLNITVLLIPDE